MRITNTSTPAVILKAEHYGSLGIVRSLGEHGVPVYAVHPTSNTPAFVSRYCAGGFVWDIEAASDESSLDFLFYVRSKLKAKAILIPTSDETSLFVQCHGDILADWFTFPRLKAEMISSLCDKKEMYSLAAKRGIPAPETFFPRSLDDVFAVLERIEYPVALKGIDGGKLEKQSGRKMVLIHTQQELFNAYEAMEDRNDPNLMIQEYIPGSEDAAWMFNGYFNGRSDCLAAFTGKKIRQNPVYLGMTSLGLCQWNERIAEMAEQFLKNLNYKGIVDIDYRYDARDGQYKILDVNPRVGATFRMFVARNGMDVVQTMYLDLTGQSIPHIVHWEGRKWIVEDKDLLSSYRYFRDGRLSLAAWIRSLHDINEMGYFNLRDQRPFWLVCWNHCKRQASKLLKLIQRTWWISKRTKGKYVPTSIAIRTGKEKFTPTEKEDLLAPSHEENSMRSKY